MQVAVDPHRRVAPYGRGDNAAPARQHGRAVHGRAQRSRCDCRSARAPTTARRATGSVARQPAPAGGGRAGRLRARWPPAPEAPVKRQQRLAVKPRHDGPRPWVSTARPADAQGHGHWKREPGRQFGQPPLLVLQQGRRGRAARHAHEPMVAKTEHPIVPAAAHLGQRQVCEIRMLVRQQGTHKRYVDLDVRHTSPPKAGN